MYAERGVKLNPIYLTSAEFDEVTPRERRGLEVCLDNILVVLESELSWEQVIDFRKDRESVQKLNRLRRWFTLELAEKGEDQIKASIEKKLDDYQYTLKKHGIKTILAGTTSVGAFMTATTTAALVTAAPMAALLGGLVLAAGAIVWIRERWIEKLDIERDEVAYIYDVEKLVR